MKTTKIHKSLHRGNGNTSRSKAAINKDIIVRFNEVIMDFCYPPYVTRDTTVEDIREAAVKALERMSHGSVIRLALYFKQRYAHWYNFVDISTTEQAKRFCYNIIHRLASYMCDLGDDYYRDPLRVGREVGSNVELKEIYISNGKGGDERIGFCFCRSE